MLEEEKLSPATAGSQVSFAWGQNSSDEVQRFNSLTNPSQIMSARPKKATISYYETEGNHCDQEPYQHLTTYISNAADQPSRAEAKMN